jgi:hypothetical protein
MDSWDKPNITNAAFMERNFKRSNILPGIDVYENRRVRTLNPLDQPRQQARMRVRRNEKGEFHQSYIQRD